MLVTDTHTRVSHLGDQTMSKSSTILLILCLHILVLRLKLLTRNVGCKYVAEELCRTLALFFVNFYDL